MTGSRGEPALRYNERAESLLEQRPALTNHPTLGVEKMADAEPTKKCPRCGETKSIANGYTFTWRKRANDRVRVPHPYCRSCRVTYNRDIERRVDASHLSVRRRRGKLRRNYGITPEQHAAQAAAQGGACAICKTSFSGLSPQTVHVDHCHETGALRGILCGRCNTAIGALSDSPEALLTAIRYVQSGGVWVAGAPHFGGPLRDDRWPKTQKRIAA